MKKKPTITIGIPAYNEEGNIAALLTSILKQKQISYTLERILVKCDGCTDKTAEIVQKWAKKSRCIKLEVTKIRSGKAAALNKIYREHKSDYLLTMDADLVFERTDEIEKMVRIMEGNSHIDLVGPRHIPIWQDSPWGRFSYVSYRSFEDAFLRWKNGNNYYAVMSANLIRGTFSKTFTFPEGTISDQCYLYAKATRGNPYGFRLVKDARVFFRPVNTFMDWRLLGVRSVAGDKNDLAKHFGNDILKEIAIPKRLAYAAQIKWLMKNPWYMLGSILMNIYIRKFPYKKMKLTRGIWETTMSSKKAIIT